MQKHILYLSYDGLTDPLGSSQVLPYVLGLARKGFRFTVLSFEKPERFAEAEAEVNKTLAGENIRWIPLVYHKTPPVLSTLRDVKTLNKMVEGLRKTDPFQLIHCRSYITSLTGLRFKKKYGIPFLFDMRAFYPDERADGGLWPKKHPLFGAVYRFFKKKEIEFLDAADHTIVLTHAGAKIMREGGLTGTPYDKPLTVIPCCADMDVYDYQTVDPTLRQTYRRELRITGQTFVLGYSGSVGTWYMLPEMMAFYRKLLTKNPDSLFLVLTRDNPQHIMDEARRADVPENKVQVRAVARDGMAGWLSVFDASVFFILPSFSKQASSPTKQGELMGMGIPVVCNAGVGDTEKIVTESGGGHVLQNLGKNDYAAAAQYCLTIKPDRGQIRRYGADYYGLLNGVEKYYGAYTSVLGL